MLRPYPIAVLALVTPDDDDDDNAELFAFSVPHADVELPELLEQVASEMNARERDAIADEHADKMMLGEAPLDAWTPQRIRREFHVSFKIMQPEPFVTL
jgi:hypothetical protein